MKNIVTMVVAAVPALLILTAVAWTLTATSRSDVISGRTVGEVVVNNNTIPLRIRYAAGGLSPVERADVVAKRLQQIGDYQPSDVTTGIMNGQSVVIIRGQLVATADNSHAAANNTMPVNLAMAWRDNFRAAVAPSISGGIGGGPVESTSSKIVPIISVGTGVRVGVAQVSGESEQVAKVKAVAQIEGQFQNKARVRALVPIGTEEVGGGGIDRVPRTSVTAYADIRL